MFDGLAPLPRILNIEGVEVKGAYRFFSLPKDFTGVILPPPLAVPNKPLLPSGAISQILAMPGDQPLGIAKIGESVAIPDWAKVRKLAGRRRWQCSGRFLKNSALEWGRHDTLPSAYTDEPSLAGGLRVGRSSPGSSAINGHNCF